MSVLRLLMAERECAVDNAPLRDGGFRTET